MKKREKIITALARKLHSGSTSFAVLVHQFKRTYPMNFKLADAIVKTEARIGREDEPTDEEIDYLVSKIKMA